MRCVKFASKLLLCTALLAAPLLASAGVPNLLGKWQATGKVLLGNGKTSTVNWTITIKRQQDHLFVGSSSWNAADQSEINQKVEPFIGVIDLIGRSIFFTETKQNAKMFARLNSANSMVVNLVGSGEDAAVSRAIFHRKKMLVRR